MGSYFYKNHSLRLLPFPLLICVLRNDYWPDKRPTWREKVKEVIQDRIVNGEVSATKQFTLVQALMNDDVDLCSHHHTMLS
jgi:hypothetical protein